MTSSEYIGFDIVDPMLDRRVVNYGPSLVNLESDRREHGLLRRELALIPAQVQQREGMLRTASSLEADCSDAERPKEGILTIDPTKVSAADRQVRDGFMDLRLAYVREMGWLEGIESDIDRYDEEESSKYIVKYKESDTEEDTVDIVCGIRFTSVTSIRDSLTWEMLQKRPDLQLDLESQNKKKLEEIDRLAAEGLVWDLTRLSPQVDGTASMREITEGIHELLGVLLYETAIKSDTKPVWVFLTTDNFKRFLDSSGIKHDVLIADYITQGDNEKSHMCIVDPVSALQVLGASEVKRHRTVYRRISDTVQARV